MYMSNPKGYLQKMINNFTFEPLNVLEHSIITFDILIYCINQYIVLVII